MTLSARSQLLLLVSLLFVAYLPALGAGVNSVDDARIIAAYGMGDGRELGEILLPSGSYYYRPLVELTYYLDNLFWGMLSRPMHLENVLFHAGNVVLVFLLGRQLARGFGVDSSWFPLLAALLFALHPINSESVTWIAGRTDPLAGFFLLAALYFTLECLLRESLITLWPALFCFALGVLSKEIALCFLPAALLLVLCWPDPVPVKRRLLRILSGLCAFCLLLVLCFVLFGRSFSFAALMGGEGGMPGLLRPALTALGFYLKKLLLPLPLNFAIDRVSSLYLLPGIAFVLLLPLCIWRSRLFGVLFSLVGILLLPALLVALKPVAWTPYAERYLYIPCAFFCLALGAAGALWAEKAEKRQWLLPAGVLLALACTIFTFQRNLVWHDNLSLYRDAVQKSPLFAGVHLELGKALLQEGRLDEARAELESAERLNLRPSIRTLISTNLMSLHLEQGDPAGALEYFRSRYPDRGQADAPMLALHSKALESLAQASPDIAFKKALQRGIIANHELCYLKTGDPFHLYQSGLLAFRCGDRPLALGYLERAVREMPAQAHYSAAAGVWLQKLKAGR